MKKMIMVALALSLSTMAMSQDIKVKQTGSQSQLAVMRGQTEACNQLLFEKIQEERSKGNIKDFKVTSVHIHATMRRLEGVEAELVTISTVHTLQNKKAFKQTCTAGLFEIVSAQVQTEGEVFNLDNNGEWQSRP